MLTAAERQPLIEKIRDFPEALATLVANFSEEQLTTSFLDQEWTIAQNVHHTADSHMNSYIRLKLMLTEDNPTLKPYDEAAWAHFADATPANLELTFQLLRGLHGRWTAVFESLTEAQWQRSGFHPENGQICVEDLLTGYVAHGEAHLEQIRRTLKAAGA
jgi:hypothetical protein